jgi:general stress protein 26
VSRKRLAVLGPFGRKRGQTVATSLSYEALEQEIIQELQRHTVGVLATSEGDCVTARSISPVFDGLRVSCFTSPFSRKVRQIRANENVSVAVLNIQIDGVARLKGGTTEPQNAAFLKEYEDFQPEVYAAYRQWLLSPEVPTEVIEVHPTRIAVYTGMPDPHTDVLDVDEKTATRYSAGEAPA